MSLGLVCSMLVQACLPAERAVRAIRFRHVVGKETATGSFCCVSLLLAVHSLISSCMPDTIFSKIIRGEIPCHRLYDDAHVLAFLDIFPLSKGHTLVIPKQAVETLDQLSDDSAAALGRVLPRLCRAVMKATGCRAYNILQNNGSLAHQAVMHVHFHIIPKFENSSHGPGLGINWPAGKLDPKDAESLVKAITAAL
jgi:histidine triad (HIT) family protein